jgi:hypothetical protein
MVDQTPPAPGNKQVPIGVSTLFRFLHITDPATVAAHQSAANKRVIQPPATASSLFLSAIEPLNTQQEVEQAVSQVLQTFIPLKNYKEVVATNPSLFDFAVYMSTFKKDTPAAEVQDKMAAVQPLTPAIESQLWDNLFYQALKNTSAKTTDVIILMLRAKAFLNELTPVSLASWKPETVDTLLQVANASIIIPRKLVAREKTQSLTGSPIVDSQTKNGLNDLNTADVATYRIKQLEDTIQQLDKANSVYQKRENIAFEAANKAYYAQAMALMDIQGPLEPLNCNPAEEEPIKRSPNNYPGLPPFKYERSDAFAPAFIDEQLSPTAKSIYLQFKSDKHTSLDQVAETLGEETRKYYKALYSTRKQTPDYIMYKGATIPLNNKPAANSVIINAVPSIKKEATGYNIFVTQYFDNPGLKFKSISLQLNPATPLNAAPASFAAANAQEQPLASSVGKLIGQSDTHVTFMFFDNGTPAGEKFRLSASYRLENGKENPNNDEGLEFTPGQPAYARGKGNEQKLDGIPGSDGVNLFGVNKVGVGDFMRVEQEICCYVPGEVSHIENIMAREYKEKTSRNLTRSETVTEETTEREQENVRDTTTTERFELHSEISRVMQEDKSMQIGANASVSAEYSGVTISAAGNLNSTNSSGVTNSFNKGEAYAKEVVDRAMERVVEKMTYKRTSRMLREFEETDKHGFDNRAGEQHVTGIYRWVDKIFENRLINYGKRLMYDFTIPEPAKNFKHWIKMQQGSGSNDVGVPPVAPIAPGARGINNATDINRWNYADIAGLYDAKVEACPPQHIDIGKAIAESPLLTGAENKKKKGIFVGSAKFDMELPDGYFCNYYHFRYSRVLGANWQDTCESVVAIGAHQWWFGNWNNGWDWEGVPASYTQTLPISIITNGPGAFHLNIIALCNLHPDAYLNWQNQAYLKIMEGYNKKLKEYNDAKADFDSKVAAALNQSNANTDQAIDYSFNPLYARAIEQRELKRLCMELMLIPYYMPLGYNHYQLAQGSSDIYDVKRDWALYLRGRYIKFIEDAFDWDIMAYLFYPYYWAEKNEWPTLIKETSSADYIFQSFVQSGMARVTLPVRPGYEKAVLYFLDTGVVLDNKDLLPGDDNDVYQDIVQTLTLEKPVQVGESWHTRMPTALTIIQSNAGPYDYNGLPCKSYTKADGTVVYCEDGTPIATGTNVLKGLEAATASGSTTTTGTRGTFTYPKHSTLSAADIGKLLMNDGDGLAKVYQLAPPTTQQLGKFVITLPSLDGLFLNSAIEIETSGGSNHHLERFNWLNATTPATVAEELALIKAYIESRTDLANLTVTIDGNNLVLQEIAVNYTTVQLKSFAQGTIQTEVASCPALPAAPTAFPLGKLVGIENGMAVISSENVETFDLEGTVEIDNSLFDSSFNLLIDPTSQADALQVMKNIIVPAANGKVKALALQPEDLQEFFVKFRTQLLGVAITAGNGQVKVIRGGTASYFVQLVVKLKNSGVFDNDHNSGTAVGA